MTTRPEDYDEVIDRLLQRLPRLQEEVRRNRELVDRRYSDLVDCPVGQQRTLIRNSPPTTLLALAHRFMQQSFEARFGDVRRSLRLAQLALQAAERVSTTDYLSAETSADLRAEALLHVGNAERLNSNLRAAEAAFNEAEEQLRLGTRDRSLKATLLSFRASLRLSEGRLEEAGSLWDREVALRQAMGDRVGLGSALVNQGLVATWIGSLDSACELYKRAIPLVEEDREAILALFPLGEALAREGRADDARLIASRAETCARLIGADEFRPRIEWLKGVTDISLRHFDLAEQRLTRLRRSFQDAGRSLVSAVVSMDLACVLADQGRREELRELATEVHDLLLAAGVERKALAVFLLFRRAVENGEVSTDLAVDVANYLARFRYNREAKFEPSGE